MPPAFKGCFLPPQTLCTMVKSFLKEPMPHSNFENHRHTHPRQKKKSLFFFLLLSNKWTITLETFSRVSVTPLLKSQQNFLLTKKLSGKIFAKHTYCKQCQDFQMWSLMKRGTAKTANFFVHVMYHFADCFRLGDSITSSGCTGQSISLLRWPFAVPNF